MAEAFGDRLGDLNFPSGPLAATSDPHRPRPLRPFPPSLERPPPAASILVRSAAVIMEGERPNRLASCFSVTSKSALRGTKAAFSSLTIKARSMRGMNFGAAVLSARDTGHTCPMRREVLRMSKMSVSSWRSRRGAYGTGAAAVAAAVAIVVVVLALGASAFVVVSLGTVIFAVVTGSYCLWGKAPEKETLGGRDVGRR